jgi:uncharacterized protein (DUF305 family)
MLMTFIARRTAFAFLLAASASASSLAQTPHADHGTPQSQGQETAPPADMERMMRTMREMMPMMERMRTASPQERAQMMERMSPMMQDMMPMMQGMMGGQGMGTGRMTGPGHQGHRGSSAAASPSTRAFEEANAKMHRDMAISFIGNADIDFVRGMIPHHQGAIDMARVVLQFGTNEQTKKWANEIIVAQEREIAEMKEWLSRNSR